MKENKKINKKPRTVGFEYEYSDLSPNQVSKIIQDIWGGQLTKKHETFYEVQNTRVGNFTIELDAEDIQKITAKSAKIQHKNNPSLLDEATIVASKAVDKISQTVVPYEVVTPPLELKDFKDLKTFEKQMHLQGASGTKIKPHYAFGLHINPEATSFQTNDLLNVLKTHAMLEKWLVKQHKVDLTRRLTNFIDPFPKNYIKLIIQDNYNPSEEQFIKDYHKYNPTRNRSLDMTPLLCHLNEPLTRKLYGTHEKINKRPTFHYRLPNCEIGQKNWSFTKEWEIWSTVEKIANNDHAIEKLKACWLEYQNSLFHSETLYNENIDKIIKEHEI